MRRRPSMPASPCFMRAPAMSPRPPTSATLEGPRRARILWAAGPGRGIAGVSLERLCRYGKSWRRRAARSLSGGGPFCRRGSARSAHGAGGAGVAAGGDLLEDEGVLLRAPFRQLSLLACPVHGPQEPLLRPAHPEAPPPGWRRRSRGPGSGRWRAWSRARGCARRPTSTRSRRLEGREEMGWEMPGLRTAQRQATSPWGGCARSPGSSSREERPLLFRAGLTVSIASGGGGICLRAVLSFTLPPRR